MTVKDKEDERLLTGGAAASGIYQQQLAASPQPTAQTVLKYSITQIRRILSNKHTPQIKVHKDSSPILRESQIQDFRSSRLGAYLAQGSQEPTCTAFNPLVAPITP